MKLLKLYFAIRQKIREWQADPAVLLKEVIKDYMSLK